MTTTFRVADRVRATRHSRSWLGTSGGTVIAVHAATEELSEEVTVSWDFGATLDAFANDIERIGIR